MVKCDPLGAAPAPIALGEAIAIGRASDGTLYLIERPDESSEYRAFESSGSSLVRHVVAGTGEGHDADGTDHYNILVDSAADGFTLIAEVSRDRRRMLVAPGWLAKQLDIDAAQGEELEIVGKEALEPLTLHNLPGDVHIEYSAALPDGERLVVVRPEYDASYEQFRLFLGPRERMEEREVFAVNRSKDGGSTHIEFQLGARRADVFFPHRFDGMGGVVDEPVTLDDGGTTLELALDRPPAAPEGASYRCLR